MSPDLHPLDDRHPHIITSDELAEAMTKGLPRICRPGAGTCSTRCTVGFQPGGSCPRLEPVRCEEVARG